MASKLVVPVPVPIEAAAERVPLLSRQTVHLQTGAYISLRRLLGASAAQRALLFWQSDHYTEIYRAVMQDGDTIDAIARQYRLIPQALADH